MGLNKSIYVLILVMSVVIFTAQIPDIKRKYDLHEYGMLDYIAFY